MAHLTILRTYAERVDPNTLPPTVKLCHSDASVTIFDKYPKAHFHFILVPFIRPPLTAANLRDLRSLLQLPREQAKALLRTIHRDALAAKALVEAEMLEKYGFTWDIHMGFHSVPSLEYVPLPLKHLQHIHLHIISTDFLGEFMRSKKHLNSFDPSRGFFIHLDKLLSWFDMESTEFAKKSDIVKIRKEKLLKRIMKCPLLKKDLKEDETEYETEYETEDEMEDQTEDQLKELLKRMTCPTCPDCPKLFRTMPKVREHLRRVFDSKVKAAQSAMETASNAPVGDSGDSEVTVGAKRKHDPPEATQAEDADGQASDGPHPSKKQQTVSSSTDLPENP